MYRTAKTAIVLVFVLLSLSYANRQYGYRTQILESGDDYILCQVFFDSVQVMQKNVDGKWFTEISIPGCAYSDVLDRPRVPVASIILGIPTGGTPQITIIDQQSVTRPLGQLLPFRKEFDVQTGTRNAEQLHSESGNWFPEKLLDRGGVGMIRNQRLLQIELHPVRYQQQQQLTQILHSIRFRVKVARKPSQMGKRPVGAKASLRKEFEDFFRDNLANYQSAKKYRTNLLLKTTDNARIESTPAPFQYKLLVEDDGVYVVTGKELKAAGADLQTIDPGTLSLSNRGHAVPILVEGAGDGSFDAEDRLIFLGRHNPGDNTYYSWYSETNVYWLSWGAGSGSRFAEISALPRAVHPDTVTTARANVHLEYDLRYERLLRMPRGDLDHWFWQNIGIGESFKIELPVHDAADSGKVSVRIALQGLTHLTTSPDHHAVIKLNGESIGDAIWDNQKPYLFASNDIPSDVLRQGKTLEIDLPGDNPSVNVDKVAVNWVEIEYNRKLMARNDSLDFSLDSLPEGVVRLDSFKTKKVYLLTDQGQVMKNVLVKKTGDSFSFYFSPRSSVPLHVTAIGEDRLKHVEKIVREEPSELRNPQNGADYIIITHAEFLKQAQQLADYRSSQGLRTLVVDVQDIYDEFNYGIYDPRAIRAFLQYAYENWQRPAPTYILLLGDTTHEMDKKVARQSNYKTFVPTMMEYTESWGMTSSDNYFVAVSGDDPLPDMFIGRLPADTQEDARVMVQKTIDYETKEPHGEWRRHLCLLTGNNEYFENSARFLYDNYIPRRFVTDWVSTDYRSPHFGSTEEVANYINSGQSILNFIGHGGGGVYFDSELFLTEDVNRLNNKNRYPVAFSLTCFIGHFDNPDMPSLSEDLLKAPDKGIVAHFGSAGRAYLVGDFFLNNALFEAIFHRNLRRIGNIVSYAKFEMIRRSNSYWDHVRNYILMGDPALQMNLPDDNINMQLSRQALFVGDKLSVSGSVEKAGSGILYLSVFNGRDSLLVQKELQIQQDGQFATDLFTLDSETLKKCWPSGGHGFVRAYFNNGDIDGASAVGFVVQQPLIERVDIEPENPTNMTPVYLTIHLNETSVSYFGGVDSVQVQWSPNQTNWYAVETALQGGLIWRTTRPIKKTEGTTVYFRVNIVGRNGQTIEGEIHSFYVKHRPDLIVDRESIVVGGRTQTVLRATIRNLGEFAAGPFTLAVYNGTEVRDENRFGDELALNGLAANADTTVSLTLPKVVAGEETITFKVDVENQVEEADEKNNVTQKTLRVATPQSGTGSFLAAANSGYAVQIMPGSVDENISLHFEKQWTNEYAKAASQSALAVVKTDKDEITAISVILETKDKSLRKPAQIAAYYSPTDTAAAYYASKSALRIYAWNAASQTWNGLPSKIDAQNHLVTAMTLLEHNTFSLLASTDNEPPEIHISVAGQNFVDGDGVGSKPTFQISVQDESGFDRTRTPIKVYIDDEQIDQNDLSVFQNPETKNVLTVTWAPQLESGEHQMKVEAMDINGNSSMREVSFSVAGNFSLASIANHPNPFSDATTIAFTLTNMASEVKLGIYTVSGRLIRTFVFHDVMGYIEQDWDGTDEDGNPVANGVYYLKFSATNKQGKIERIEKMARLQ